MASPPTIEAVSPSMVASTRRAESPRGSCRLGRFIAISWLSLTAIFAPPTLSATEILPGTGRLTLPRDDAVVHARHLGREQRIVFTGPDVDGRETAPRTAAALCERLEESVHLALQAIDVGPQAPVST